MAAPGSFSRGGGAVNKQIIFKLETDISNAIQGINAMSAALNDMNSELHKSATADADKARSIGLINLRDFGSTLTIQAQQWRALRQEMEEGFVSFEKVTQDITVLDSTMTGLRHEVGETATALAVQFGITREESAMTLKDITALGLSFDEAAALMEVAGKGAAAGMGTVENAASVLITTMRQFGIPFEDADIVMAKLVSIANETSFNIDDMRQALSTAGPQAAALGFSLEETAASMAIMRDAGLDASEAGTAMRNFLIRLQDPTSQASALLGELGVDLTDDQGKFLDLTTILENVGKATEGLSDQERLQIQATLFEVRGQQLLNITRSRTLDNLKNLISETGKYNDKATAEAFLNEKSSQALDRLGVGLNAAKERANQLQAQYAEKLIPQETTLINVQNSLFKTFLNLPGPIQDVAAGLHVFGTELVGNTGQMFLWLANVSTLIDKLPISTQMIEKMSVAMKNHKYAAIGAGLAVGGIITAYALMQEQDPKTRQALTILTSLEWGLAAATLAVAIAKQLEINSIIPVVGAAIGAAAAIYIVATYTDLLGKAKAVGAAEGAFVLPKAGGSLYMVGEGGQPEIISPVPMMRETIREVIRENGGTGGVTIHQNLNVSPFNNITESVLSDWTEQSAKVVTRKLRAAGILAR